MSDLISYRKVIKINILDDTKKRQITLDPYLQFIILDIIDSNGDTIQEKINYILKSNNFVNIKNKKAIQENIKIFIVNLYQDIKGLEKVKDLTLIELYRKGFIESIIIDYVTININAGNIKNIKKVIEKLLYRSERDLEYQIEYLNKSFKHKNFKEFYLYDSFIKDYVQVTREEYLDTGDNANNRLRELNLKYRYFNNELNKINSVIAGDLKIKSI